MMQDSKRESTDNEMLVTSVRARQSGLEISPNCSQLAVTKSSCNLTSSTLATLLGNGQCMVSTQRSHETRPDASLKDHRKLHLAAKALMVKLPVSWDGCDHARLVGFASCQEPEPKGHPRGEGESVAYSRQEASRHLSRVLLSLIDHFRNRAS